MVGVYRLSATLSAWSVAACTGCVYGYNTSIISGLSYTLVVNTYFSGVSDASELSTMQGLLTACTMIGALLGSLIGPYQANRYGRRAALSTCGIITAAFCIALGAVDNFIAACVLRVCVGVGVGFSCTVGPLYMAEVAPVHLRGSLGVLFEVGIALGQALALLINYVASPQLAGDLAAPLTRPVYGAQFGVGAAPAVALIFLPYMLPETNVHNTAITQSTGVPTCDTSSSDMIDDVNCTDQPGDTATLNDTELNTGPARHQLSTDVSLPVSDIAQASMSVPRRAWRTLFTTRRGAYYLCMAALLCATDMLTGINSIFFYSPTIFAQAGLNNVLLYTFIFVGIGNLLSCILPYMLVDRVGRRSLFNASLCGMSVAMLLLTLNYLTFPQSVTAALSIVFVLLFLVAWTLGTGALFFLLAAELFPDDVREEALILTNMCSWALNITMSLLFPVLTASIGIGYTILIQLIICLICNILAVAFLPETKHQQFAATQLIHKE